MGGTFASINAQSTDPCEALSVTPTYTVGIMSVTLASTPVAGCGAPPACATMSPQCLHGSCTDTVVGPTCAPCPSGGGFSFGGSFCETNVCLNECGGAARGTCDWSSPALLPSCTCSSSQWTSADCSVPVCEPAGCANGGTCLATIPPVCSCAAGWQGPDCTVPLFNNTCPSSCGPGTCSVSSNFTCLCPAGYAGLQCQILSCPNACTSNGVCVAGASGPICNCMPSFAGASCDTRQCVPLDCLNGGTCSVALGSVTCTCTNGWTGANCQLPFSSPSAGSGKSRIPALQIVLLVDICRACALCGCDCRHSFGHCGSWRCHCRRNSRPVQVVCC